MVGVAETDGRGDDDAMMHGSSPGEVPATSPAHARTRTRPVRPAAAVAETIAV